MAASEAVYQAVRVVPSEAVYRAVFEAMLVVELALVLSAELVPV